MPEISRRSMLQSLGWLSAAGTIGRSVLGCKSDKPIPAMAAPHGKNDLYLIFTGAWLMSFEGNKIRMITADFDKHTYDYVKNPVQGASTTHIDANAKYEVIVDSPPNTTSPKNLVKPMADLQQGFIFNEAVSLNCANLQSYQNLRSILVPMPTAIAADAIVSGIKVYADGNTIQSAAVGSWPSAFALVYSGWNWMKIQKNGIDTEPPVQSGSITHYRFRVCPDGYCDPDKGCPGSHTCREVDMQEAHNSTVFDTLIGMLTFAPGPKGEPRYKPAISFPTCVTNQDGTIDPKLTVSRGSEKDNISNFEVGMPENEKGQFCIFYANLHNCAASGLIVNAVS